MRKRWLKEKNKEVMLLKRLISNGSLDADTRQRDEDSVSLEDHDIRSFVSQLRDAVNPEREAGLRARPAIRENLIERLGNRTNGRTARSRVHDLLQLRIPLYQAAAVSVALVLTFILLSWPQTTRDSASNQMPVESVEHQVIDSLRIIQNIRLMENQKLGRSIEEDSLLIRFIRTSVDLFK